MEREDSDNMNVDNNIKRRPVGVFEHVPPLQGLQQGGYMLEPITCTPYTHSIKFCAVKFLLVKFVF